MQWQTNSGPLDGRRILIADDSESGRDLLRFILERSGCKVFEAHDGEEAFLLALNLLPDLLILDLNLPQRDGYSVAVELRSRLSFAETPIIALSAGVAQTDDARIAASGFSMSLPKPVTPARLRACIKRFLAHD